MGRQKIIGSPKELHDLFENYKEWVKENPYLVNDYRGKDATQVWIKKQRPITWIGFEGWLAASGIISQLTHYEQNADESYTEFLPTIRAIKRQISQDIVDGALAGVFNQNIAARIEGLTDKKEIKRVRLNFKDAE